MSSIDSLAVNLISELVTYFYQHYIFATVLFLITYWILVCLLKPRNLPPGPINIPFFGGSWILTSNPYNDFERLWKKYGNLVSVYVGNKLMIYIFSKRLIKEVYISRGDDFQARVTEDLPFEDVLFHQPYGEAWKKSKKVIVQLHKKFIMNNIENEALKSLEDLSWELQQTQSKLVNPKNLLRQFHTQIIFSLYFNERKPIDDTELKEVGSLMSQVYTATSVHYNSWVLFVPFSSLIFRRALNKPSVVVSKLRRHYEVRYEERLSRIEGKNPSEASDIMEALMIELGDLTKIQIIDTMIILSIDAIHSQTIALQTCLLYLAYYPKLQGEIHDLLDKSTDNQPPNLTHRQDLVLIDALYLETLRTDDILSESSSHRPIKDTTLEGYNIPKNAILVPVSSSIHFDDGIYPNSEKFDPKRFIKDGKLSFKRDEYLSFGIGPRSCTGEQFSRTVVFLTIARLLHQFRISLSMKDYFNEKQLKTTEYFDNSLLDVSLVFSPRR
ncbi:DgyrCDS1668 [Dimorphilus gyrociliatus]|uniref:DgyrCDS1668 n=1 Tax=Dimorphilus gyrociliatus TaxID=2664684 RepID=A0A7I8V9U9_9ANNE|nr:DgyrCDS1668 [Dimorphilus gyrociliatus]